MLRGKARLAISMILGVLGIFSPKRIVTVSMVVPSITMRYRKDVSENRGTPRVPAF